MAIAGWPSRKASSSLLAILQQLAGRAGAGRGAPLVAVEEADLAEIVARAEPRLQLHRPADLVAEEGDAAFLDDVEKMRAFAVAENPLVAGDVFLHEKLGQAMQLLLAELGEEGHPAQQGQRFCGLVHRASRLVGKSLAHSITLATSVV